MKLSEKLYGINGAISILTFVRKERLTLKDQEELNKLLTETIKVLREQDL